MRQKGLSQPNSLRWFWLLSVGLLVAGFVAGYGWSAQFAAQLEPSLKGIQNLVVQMKQHPSLWNTFWTIFTHNVFVSILMILLGIGAGIFPAILIWSNGLLIGFVVSMSVLKLHVSAWKMIVFGLLPHGVFELTAFLWATALGLQMGFSALHEVWAWIRRGLRRAGQSEVRSISFRVEMRRTLFALPWIIGLLLVAATIESTLTPVIIHWAGISG